MPPDLPDVPVEGTDHGAAYRAGAVRGAVVDGAPALLAPVLARSERLGVLEVRFGSPPGPGAEPLVAAAGLVLGYAAVVADHWTDELAVARRRKDMSLAAELQWSMLPLAALTTARVAVGCAIEPAYDIAGDLYEYACGPSHLLAGVFDSMGNGLGSARLSTLAVSTYRNARRSGLGLEEQARAVDRVVADAVGDLGFATALLVVVDLAYPRRSSASVRQHRGAELTDDATLMLIDLPGPWRDSGGRGPGCYVAGAGRGCYASSL